MATHRPTPSHRPGQRDRDDTLRSASSTPRGSSSKMTEDQQRKTPLELEDGSMEINQLLREGEEKNSSSAVGVPPAESTLRKGIILALCFVGLQGSYLTWGYLQEVVMKSSYAPEGEPPDMFPSSIFIVFSNRLLALLVAVILVYSPVLEWAGGAPPGPRKPNAPLLQFSPCSISNVLSSWAQYECLHYISFPMQVVSKSCKVIPVMLVGKFVHGRSYPWVEYFEAVGITVGVSLFGLSNGDPKDGEEKATQVWGLLLVAMYLTCDSFTSQWQDRVFKKYSIDQYQMMLGINLFSILFTSMKMIWAGELILCLNFLSVYPLAKFHIMLLSITSATGQLFIFYTIKKFGPIIFTIIMTCRQMLSMVISCIVFAHTIGLMGVFGAMCVFGTIGYRIQRKLRGNK